MSLFSAICIGYLGAGTCFLIAIMVYHLFSDIKWFVTELYHEIKEMKGA